MISLLAIVTLLALSDGWAIGMWIVNLGMTLALALVVYGLNVHTRRIETLETRVRDGSESLIDERFDALRSIFEAKFDALQASIDGVNARLARGDDKFNSAQQTDAEQEIRFMTRIADLRSYVETNCASKEDVRELTRELHALRERVAGNAGGAQ